MTRNLSFLPWLALAVLPLLAVAAGGPTIKVDEFTVGERRADVSLSVVLDLNETLRDALDGGLEVVFRLEMDVVEERWVFDRDLYGSTWTGSLRRRKYGQGYEYRPFGSGDWRDADSVDAALEGLRPFVTIIEDRDFLADLRREQVYVLHRVEVDLDTLPNPIKVELLTTPGWDFSSGWLRTWR